MTYNMDGTVAETTITRDDNPFIVEQPNFINYGGIVAPSGQCFADSRIEIVEIINPKNPSLGIFVSAKDTEIIHSIANNIANEEKPEGTIISHGIKHTPGSDRMTIIPGYVKNRNQMER